MSAVFQRAGISVQVPAPAFYRVRLNVLAEPHLLLDWVVLRVHKFCTLTCCSRQQPRRTHSALDLSRPPRSGVHLLRSSHPQAKVRCLCDCFHTFRSPLFVPLGVYVRVWVQLPPMWTQ